MSDTFSITYRHRDGTVQRQTQSGPDLVSVIAQHLPSGVSIVTVSMRCRAIRPATGARCTRFSTAGEYCHQHRPAQRVNPLTPFHRGEV